MVDRDRQGFVIKAPQGLEQKLGLGAGVDEDDGHAGGADAGEDLGRGGEAHVAGPGEAAFGKDDGDIRRRATLGLEDAGGAAERRNGAAVGHSGGEADAAQAGGDMDQAGEAEGEHVAALGAGQRMRLVDNDSPQAFEHVETLGLRQ